MTDEQAVRKLLAEEFRYGPNTHVGQLAAQALALLDAKDAELREYKEALAFTESERDTALSRAEQAEAALAEERKAHQAFREDVSEAINSAEAAALEQGPSATAIVRHYFDPLRATLLPAKPADPDPLVAAYVEHTDDCLTTEEAEVYVAALRAAIERAGGTIEFPDALLAQRSKNDESL